MVVQYIRRRHHTRRGDRQEVNKKVLLKVITDEADLGADSIVASAAAIQYGYYCNGLYLYSDRGVCTYILR